MWVFQHPDCKVKVDDSHVGFEDGTVDGRNPAPVDRWVVPV
jgi:hypothetical protein